MFTKRILFLTVIFTVAFAHKSCAEPINETKGLLPNPIDIAKWQISKLIELVENLVKAQLKILDDIRKTISTTVDTSISNTIKIIDLIIDGTVVRIRRIFQDALDKGINVTECHVLNMDKLRILRRHLIIDEVQCVTSQAGKFYDIIDETIKNFTDDLAVVLDLPRKLKKCIITITPITCVTKIIEEITDLQKAIPKQILGTMLEIAQYLNEFDQRVHKCQFAQLRKAIEGTRSIVDNLYECVRHPDGSGGNNDEVAEQIPDEPSSEIVQN